VGNWANSEFLGQGVACDWSSGVDGTFGHNSGFVGRGHMACEWSTEVDGTFGHLATGPSGIPVEILKEGGPKLIHHLLRSGKGKSSPQSSAMPKLFPYSRKGTRLNVETTEASRFCQQQTKFLLVSSPTACNHHLRRYSLNHSVVSGHLGEQLT